jgi:pimeloyl-ACP methyl ester carboxylesterase
VLVAGVSAFKDNVSPTTPSGILLRDWLEHDTFTWLITREILTEYGEVLGRLNVKSALIRTIQIVDELSRVLARVALGEPYVLVGHSFDSFVIRAYAARNPGSVVGLVMVDPPTEWLTITPQCAHMLRGGRQLSRIAALLAEIGVVRACLALLTGGAPGAPKRFVRVFGPTAAHTLERLIGEVRKLPPDVYPILQALWCQPKCFHAMADHLRVLEREGTSIDALIPPRDIPVIVISSGNQPPEQITAHRMLAERSADGRHVIAARSAHWVQFDEPELVVALVSELVERGATGHNSHAVTA